MRRILPFFFLAMMVSWGCHRNSSLTTQAPAPPKRIEPEAVTPPIAATELETIPAEPASEAKEKPEPGDLELGEMHFMAGNYPQAIKALEAFLSTKPKPKGSNRALFYLALSQTLDSDSKNDQKVASAFKKVIDDSSDSTYKSQAKFILNLLNLPAQADKLRSDIKERDERIKKLSEELQVLKEIDLQRRPSRPKE